MLDKLFIILQLSAQYHLLYRLQPIKEEEPEGTFVGNIKFIISENDLSTKKLLENCSFSLFGKYAIKSLLQINKTTGIVLTKTKIDLDTLCESLQECCPSPETPKSNFCSIEFLTKVTYSNKRLKIYHFNFVIEDINDNSPQFRDRQFVVELKENQPPSKIALLPLAIDKDFSSTSKLEYLINGNKNILRFFSIKSVLSQTGHRVELYSHTSFDRESVNEYNLHLIARDSDNKESQMSVKIKILDENDSAPKFHFNSVYSSKVLLLENCEIGFKIMSFNVTDADEGINGNVVFSLNHDNAKNVRFLPFSTNKNGLLFVSGNVDREEVEFYDLTVVASDGGTPPQASTVKVQIEILDLNDNRPEFFLSTDHVLNHFALEENSDIDTNIGTIQVVDKDKGVNSKIHCLIEENEFSNYLKLEKIENFNIFKIQTKVVIDRELLPQLQVVLTCMDSGDTPLTSSITITINVQDVNDNYPIVDSKLNILNWEILENSAQQTYINHIKATDLDAQDNGKLYFFINQSDTVALSQFSIDVDHGIVKSKIMFDREMQEVYKFTVFIRDCGKHPLSTSVTVTIVVMDVNDNPPMFFTSNPLYIYINENTNPPYELNRFTCKDRDKNLNGKISFILDDYTDFFNLHDNGVLSLKRSIDREIYPNLQFKVIARDHGIKSLSSSITIVIEVKDVNDNAPEFIFPPSNFKMNISLDYTIGKKLLTRIVATDRDIGQNGVVVYEHEEKLIYGHDLMETNDNSKRYFSINKNNGELTLINTLRPLFLRKCLIIIYAKDLGTPSLSSSVKIEVFVVDIRNSLYSNKAPLNENYDLFNISVIIIGCISVIIITAMIGAVMMLIFQKEKINRNETGSCLMTSLTGKVPSILNEYEVSSRSSISKNISKSLSNIHLIVDNNYCPTIQPSKYNFAKHPNAGYYEVIIPKENLSNPTFSKDFLNNYQNIINLNETLLNNSMKSHNNNSQNHRDLEDDTSLV